MKWKINKKLFKQKNIIEYTVDESDSDYNLFKKCFIMTAAQKFKRLTAKKEYDIIAILDSEETISW